MSFRAINFRAATFALIALALLAAPAIAQVKEASTERVPGAFEGARVAAEQQALNRELLDLEGEKSVPGFTVEITAADRARLENAPEEGRLLVGVTKPVKTSVSFGAIGPRAVEQTVRPLANGVLRMTRGGFVWNTVVTSPGASAIRLHFTDFSLAKGVELFVYSRDGEAFGPYTGTGLLGEGELWTDTLVGSEARVIVRFTGRDRTSALRASRFTFESVVHLGSKFILPRLLRPTFDGTEAFCSFNASCVQNASCSSIPSAIQPARDAVAHIQFVVGSSAFICSGGLVNDTDTSTTVPLFLTANHCFSSSSSASSLEAYFQFETSCGGSCFNPDGVVPRVNGSTILATNSTSDYTLVQLSSGPPAGSTLLGWTSAAVAFSNGTSLFRISHPKGAPQAYSTHSVSTTKGTCASWPRGNWIYSADTFGATEGGSSGSPVLNSSGQIVGQLSGACGTNPTNPCASSSNATVDGALAAYFSSVDQYLDPSTGGSCHVGAPGTANFCSSSCQCEDGEGDCDSNSECVSGTTCVSNVGPNYGWASWVDVCESSGGGGGPNSCVGNCGSQAPGGCWCDSSCAFFGDCCSDKVSICG